MTTDDPKFTDTPASTDPTSEYALAGELPNPRWRKVRLFSLVALLIGGSSALCMGMLTGASAWYTSRSEFCNSCHIMDPYYHSWETGTHSEVACIKCHFAPGAMEKIQGKLQGLVQLCTYLTRSEGPRPVAQVEDASCLRSGCHETRSLAGPMSFHGVYFDHGPHLGTIKVGESQHEMTLRCTSCHGQGDPSVHMRVTTSNCYVCHFKDGHFNEGLGACTRCHQIPAASFDLGGNVTFNHDLVYQNGIDCKSCHGDLNRGTAKISRERCEVCHNQEERFVNMNDPVEMHRLHVTNHKVDCLECHSAIEHSLQPEKLTHAASDCASCHPNHHSEQVKMLEGTGAHSVPDYSGAMMSTRVDCRACHNEQQISATGTVVWKASADVCTACHTAVDPAQLERYEHQVNACLAELDTALKRADEALKIAALPADQLEAANAKYKRLAHDVEFLRVGSGIHNIHYASTLTKVLLEETRSLCETLMIDQPMVELPEPVTRFE
jgi:predicted CXXCH cytochrome family protein